MPHTLRLESAFRLTESLTLRPQYAWMQWSIFERQQAINADNGEVVLSQERFFNDVQAFKLAVDWLATKAVTLHFSAQFETNATPIRTFEPGLAESENWEFGLGLSLPLSESLALGASFTWQQFADVEVSNSVQKPTMNGAYTDRRQYVTIDLEVQL